MSSHPDIDSDTENEHMQKETKVEKKPKFQRLKQWSDLKGNDNPQNALVEEKLDIDPPSKKRSRSKRKRKKEDAEEQEVQADPMEDDHVPVPDNVLEDDDDDDDDNDDDEDDDEDDDDDEQEVNIRPSPRKKKARIIDDDEDDEEQEVNTQPSPRKQKKVLVIDNNEEEEKKEPTASKMNFTPDVARRVQEKERAAAGGLRKYPKIPTSRLMPGAKIDPEFKKEFKRYAEEGIVIAAAFPQASLLQNALGFVNEKWALSCNAMITVSNPDIPNYAARESCPAVHQPDFILPLAATQMMTIGVPRDTGAVQERVFAQVAALHVFVADRLGTREFLSVNVGSLCGTLALLPFDWGVVMFRRHGDEKVHFDAYPPPLTKQRPAHVNIPCTEPDEMDLMSLDMPLASIDFGAWVTIEVEGNTMSTIFNRKRRSGASKGKDEKDDDAASAADSDARVMFRLRVSPDGKSGALVVQIKEPPPSTNYSACFPFNVVPMFGNTMWKQLEVGRRIFCRLSDSMSMMKTADIDFDFDFEDEEPSNTISAMTDVAVTKVSIERARDLFTSKPAKFTERMRRYLLLPWESPELKQQTEDVRNNYKTVWNNGTLLYVESQDITQRPNAFSVVRVCGTEEVTQEDLDHFTIENVRPIFSEFNIKAMTDQVYSENA